MGNVGVGVNDTEDLGSLGGVSLGGGGGGRTLREFARDVLDCVVLASRAVERDFVEVGVLVSDGTLGRGGPARFLVWEGRLGGVGCSS